MAHVKVLYDHHRGSLKCEHKEVCIGNTLLSRIHTEYRREDSRFTKLEGDIYVINDRTIQDALTQAQEDLYLLNLKTRAVIGEDVIYGVGDARIEASIKEGVEIDNELYINRVRYPLLKSLVQIKDWLTLEDRYLFNLYTEGCLQNLVIEHHDKLAEAIRRREREIGIEDPWIHLCTWELPGYSRGRLDFMVHYLSIKKSECQNEEEIPAWKSLMYLFKAYVHTARQSRYAANVRKSLYHFFRREAFISVIEDRYEVTLDGIDKTILSNISIEGIDWVLSKFDEIELKEGTIVTTNHHLF